MNTGNKIKLSLLASALLLNSAAFADHQEHLGHGWQFTNSNQNSNNTDLTASLTGSTGFAGSGTIRYKSNGIGGDLKVKILLPVDGVTITDSNTAATSSYVLTVNNGNTLVAACNLDITDIDFTYSANSSGTSVSETAQYEAVVYEHGSQVSTNVGTCTDGSGNSQVLPALSANDTVSVTLLSASAVGSTALLTGTLAASIAHHR